MQRAKKQVDVLERFRAREDRLAGIIRIFQAVDLCLRDRDLAAVMLRICFKAVKRLFSCRIGAMLLALSMIC